METVDQIVKRTAYHEAGHAVANMLLGADVSRVWIDIAGDWVFGKCEYLGDLTPEANVLVSLAGHLAESIYLGCEPISFWDRAEWDRSDSDEVQAFEAAKLIHSGHLLHAMKYIDEQEGAVAELLISNWAVVEDLAKELIDSSRDGHTPRCEIFP